MDEARVGADETGYTLAVPPDGVANDFTFYHGRRKEPNDHISWLLGEVNKRIGIPREMFMDCVICHARWGECDHVGNNPVDVDTEAMRLIYEKAGVPVPDYPPTFADYWLACEDIYRKKRKWITT